MKRHWMLRNVMATIAIGCTSIALAQPGPGGPRGRGPGGPGGEPGFGGPGPGGPGFGGPGFGGPGPDMMRMLPIMAALDTNHDGEISKEEIANATASLTSLDKNEDGKLTHEELRPRFGGEGPGRGGPEGERRPRDGQPGEDGPRRGGPDGQRREGPGPDGDRRGGPERDLPFGDGHATVQRLMSFDKNDDGKLSKDEVEGRLQGIVQRADKDEDGFATKAEIEAMVSAHEGPGRGGEGRDGDRRGPGEPGPGPGPGPGGPRGGFGGPGGPPSPEMFLNRAFEFDADNDGKLSREELGKMLSEGPMGGPRPERGERGPEGPRPEGRRDGPRGPERDGDRPPREGGRPDRQ